MTARAVAVGSAVGFAAGWNIADTGAVADELADAYGVGLGVVGLFTTALFLAHMLMQLPSGRLSDRFGAHRVCLTGAAVMAACNALALLAAEPLLVLAARGLMGVGTALAFIGGSDYVRAAGGTPFAQGLYGGLATAGGGVALAVVPVLYEPLAWRAPFVSAALVSLGAAALLLAGPRPSRPHHVERRRMPVLGLARDKALVRLAVMFAASFGLSIVIGNWLVTLLERNTELARGEAGSIAALTLVLGAVSRPLGGFLLHHRPGRVGAGIVVAGLAGATGTLLLLASTAGVALAGAVLVGLSAGVSFAPAFTGAAHLYREAPATAIGFVNGVGALTILVGTPLVGVAFSRGDETWAFAAMAALWVLASVATTRPATRSP